jgi:hypothetical protein
MDKIKDKTGFTLQEIENMTGEELFLNITGQWLKKKITKEQHEYLLTKWEIKHNQPIELDNLTLL